MHHEIVKTKHMYEIQYSHMQCISIIVEVFHLKMLNQTYFGYFSFCLWEILLRQAGYGQYWINKILSIIGIFKNKILSIIGIFKNGDESKLKGTKPKDSALDIYVHLDYPSLSQTSTSILLFYMKVVLRHIGKYPEEWLEN